MHRNLLLADGPFPGPFGYGSHSHCSPDSGGGAPVSVSAPDSRVDTASGYGKGCGTGDAIVQCRFGGGQYRLLTAAARCGSGQLPPQVRRQRLMAVIDELREVGADSDHSLSGLVRATNDQGRTDDSRALAGQVQFE